MISNVAAIVFDRVNTFELGVAVEAWGTSSAEMGLPVFDFAVCAPRAGAVRSDGGFDVHAPHGLDRVAQADLVVVPAQPYDAEVPPDVVDVLRAAYDRGARIMSLCTGAFVLGAAGLLDGRECTTHWLHTADLATRFPTARVLPEVLYVDDGPILTSAGTAAGVDACLYLWRQEFGAAAANLVARRMVVPPHRDGGQAQFIRSAVPDDDAQTLGPLLAWIADHLSEQLNVEALASRAAMSPRTFARRFRAETGTTPHAWITARRVQRAEQLLEESDLPVERIATEVGFGNAAALRQHFTHVRGLSPTRYRRQYRLVG